MSNTNNSKPVIHLSQAKQNEMRDALRVLHSLFAAGVGLSSLPPFDACDTPDYKKVFDRALDSVTAFEATETERKYSKVKGKVIALLNTHRSEAIEANAAVQAMPEKFRKLTGATVLESVNVNATALAAAFPAGTELAAVVKALHVMGFPVVAQQGNFKDTTARPYFVKLNLAEAPAAETSQAAE